MYRPKYALLSTKYWVDASDVGSFFDIPVSAFIDTKQRITEKQWQVEEDLRDMLYSVEKSLSLSSRMRSTNRATQEALSWGPQDSGRLQPHKSFPECNRTMEIQ